MIENQTTRDQLHRLMGLILRDREWQYLVDEGKVKKAVDLDELEGEAQKVLRLRGEPVLERSENRVHILGVRNVPARNDAVSRLLAESASGRDDVRLFRQKHLRGEILRPDMVEGWIHRQAGEDGRGALRLFSIALPANRETTFKNGRPILHRTKTEKDDIEIWPLESKVLEYGVPSDLWMRKIPTCATGVLEQLRELSNRLADEYGWQPAQASLLVLAGLIPEIAVSQTDYFINTKDLAASRILLRLDPALSPAQVAKIYREARAKLLKTRYRNVGEKHTRLAAFSTLGKEGEKLGDRRAAWNKRYPKWKYKDDWNFSRDLNTARKRLLSLPFGTR